MVHQILPWIRLRWRLLFLIIVPLVLLPLPILRNTPQAKCGYLVLILALYWISEVIPLSVTSLLPLLFFPMAGILKAEVVAQSYFRDISALFFGSLSLAYAVESVNLHRRIALFVLSLVGTSTKWSMAGLMAVTAFLSMWINNSAATSIMLPVALAISDELERHGKEYHDKKQAIKEATSATNGTSTLEINSIKWTENPAPNDAVTTEVILDPLHIEEPKSNAAVGVKNRFRFPWHKRSSVKIILPSLKKYEGIRKGFLLATAYSATIGGLGTLVGTTPNIFVKGFAETTYKGTAFRINFLNFLLFALPVSLIMLILCWLWLQIFYNREEFFQYRANPETREVQANLKSMLVQQYKNIGRPHWNEYCILVIFVLMVILWLTKEFGETRGWGVLFRNEYVTDSGVAILCGVLPLILPNSNPFKSNWKYEPIIHWNNLVKNISWSVLFLLGAGLAVASAFTTSGLSDTVAEELQFLSGIPRTGVILMVIVISGLFTEVTSNLSTASIFLPVLDSIARSSGIHPAFLILPCTLAVSLAFMLPIATPPNAIVFGSGAIRVIDMIKTGVVMNLVGFLVIFFAATTWMPKIYDLDDRSTELFFGLNTTTLSRVTASIKIKG